MTVGRFDGVIIVSDIDGTFLGKDSRIVPENLEAIGYFKRGGGLFTIATGRVIYSVPRAIPMLKALCNIPVIACNGAYIYDVQAERIVAEELLPEPEISRIVDAVRAACPDVSMTIACGDRHLTDRDDPVLRPLQEKYPGRIQIIPYDDLPHGCWHAISWRGEPDRLNCVRDVVTPLLTGSCTCAFGSSRIFEVFSSRGTKGGMLPRLKSLVGMENTTLWAIGDYENDIPMLRMADRCAMPANALRSLQTVPGIVSVCHHDEGAIADLIRYIERELQEAK